MDLSFDIKNSEGDHIMIALSYYDLDAVKVLPPDPQILTLVFYDVTLVRKSGSSYVGYKTLSAISDMPAKFLEENEDAVLCFCCDAYTDVLRNHKNLLPQEYRSQLFSRMFDKYANAHGLSNLINHRVRMDNCDAPEGIQIAHFICRREYENA